MSHFITRVELHGIQHDSHVYDLLHIYMASEGFTRTIRSDSGLVHELPPAEYYMVGYYTIEQVHTKAASAANKTGKANAVLVSELLRAQWSGLPVIWK